MTIALRLAAPPQGTLPDVPPRAGEIIELAIDGLAYGGQGVGRIDDFVVFVRRAVPGDRVRAQVVKRKRSYAEARLLEIVAPSALRVPPECGHEDGCGGCEWQTLDYGAQLDFKQRQVVESLEHIGGLSGFEVEPMRGMERPWRYRNKMEYSFGSDESGRLLLGLHKRGSWREIMEVEDCWLAPPEVNRARQAVATACRALGLPPYSQLTHEGLLRHLVVRTGSAANDLLLNLYVSERFPQEGELAARVAELQPYTSFAVTVNESRADAAVGVGPFMVSGPPYLHEVLAGVRLRVPATGFLQTNSAMCSLLYETALRLAQPLTGATVLDLYCGIGAISLLLARHAACVYGLEIQEEAVQAAVENARLNGVANAAFAGGDVRKLLKPLVEGGGRDLPLPAFTGAQGQVAPPAGRP